MKYYDTEYIEKMLPHKSVGTKICVYCLHEMNHETECDNREFYEYYNCDCHDAQIERDVQINKESLSKATEENEKELNEIRYNNELVKLKYKFGIE